VNVTGWLKGLHVTADGTGSCRRLGALIRGAGGQHRPDRGAFEGRWPRIGSWSMTGAGCWRCGLR
jgi:hypothetical protein